MAADKSELRQLAPNHLLQALDAIAMAKGMERHAYIEAVLKAEVVKVGHEAMVVARCLQGNPLLGSDHGGSLP
jgi:hypothetical protein